MKSETFNLQQPERGMSVEGWKYDRREYPSGLTLPQLFESQAQEHPDSTAVVFKGTRLSYWELNSRANQLSRFLTEMGSGPEKTVMVSMDRSYEVYIAMVAIHKSGGAYVPIEPESPVSRLNYYVEDAQPELVLTQAARADRFKDCGKPVFCVDRDWSFIQDKSKENPILSANENNLSDVIYTSGSTGLPKGVLSTHKK